MAEIFVSLFVGMDWLVITLLSLGVVLLAIEIFVPGFGVFGVTGFVSVIAGILVRVIGKGLSVGMAFAYAGFIIFIVGVVVAIVFFIMVLSAKNGLINKTPIISTTTAVPVGKTASTPDYSEILGKKGVSLTDLNPSGKATIDGEIYDVVSMGEYIYANMPIKVVKIEGAIISVLKITD